MRRKAIIALIWVALFALLNFTSLNAQTNIEAESGVITPPMVSVSDAGASGGFYIEANDNNQTGLAIYDISISQAGIYEVVARVFGPDGGGDSFFFQIDSQAEEIWDFNVADYGEWEEIKVTQRNGQGDGAAYNPYTVHLGASPHTLKIRTREANAKLDYFRFVLLEPNLDGFDLAFEWDPMPDGESWTKVRLYEAVGPAAPYSYYLCGEVDGDQITMTITDVSPGRHIYVARSFNGEEESENSNDVRTSPCDLNLDIAVDVLDLQRAINAIMNGTEGDANIDGKTDVLDLQIIINKILGASDCP